MKLAIPFALGLALAACAGNEPSRTPTASPTNAAQANTPVAQVPNNTDAALETQVRTLLAPPPNSGLKLETQDVDVDLADPNGQRAVVSYLLRPEVWSLIKVEMPSATRRVYRFQRVQASNGATLPDLDPLKPR